MKKMKRTVSVLSVLAASAMLAGSAGAHLTVVEDPSEYLNSDEETWQFVLPEKHNEMAIGVNRLEFVVTFDGDEAEYNKERSSGYYDNDSGKSFADFEGYIGIGARVNVKGKDDNWYSFNYKTLTSGVASNSPVITKLDDTTYLFSCTLTDVEILPTERDIQLSFKDWGNASDYYKLTVREFYAYDADGTVAIYADEKGTAEFGTHAALDLSAYGIAPVTEATTTAAATTTEAATTTAAAAAVTTAPTTTAPAYTTPAKGGTVESAAADYSERDSTLLIVGIVAGVLIIGVIVGIILYIRNKKKRNHWREGLE